MLVHLRRSLTMAIICLVFFGFVYALAGTGVAQLLFKHQADGSITANGSTLIGQNWSSPKWFHGRPDDTGPYAANPKATPPAAGGDNPLVANGNSGQSGATNLGPHSKVLLTNTQALVAYWHSLGVDNPTPDLVTTSGSGYDPDITPADALVQIPMVAKATGISASRLQALIAQETNGAQLGFLGSSYIDVLQLNEALANLH
ncbi:MAG TPA: potassium-transporting ATPase subunit C [Acidimicrobiales bacterium]|jgi:K+-transporting ATPase ATPase C chain|nr:potassium-transporting ATPase subunit C [Acidimicrobiales bacterium]